MLMWEIQSSVKRRPSKGKATKSKTNWELNLAKLRSKEREFDAKRPVKPVKID